MVIRKFRVAVRQFQFVCLATFPEVVFNTNF